MSNLKGDHFLVAMNPLTLTIEVYFEAFCYFHLHIFYLWNKTDFADFFLFVGYPVSKVWDRKSLIIHSAKSTNSMTSLFMLKKEDNNSWDIYVFKFISVVYVLDPHLSNCLMLTVQKMSLCIFVSKATQRYVAQHFEFFFLIFLFQLHPE